MQKRVLCIELNFENQDHLEYAYFPFNLEYVEVTFCYTEAIKTKRGFSTSKCKFLADGICRDGYETDYL